MADQPSERTRSPGDRIGSDALFSALADEHRRNVLRYFQASGDEVTTVDDLVEYAVPPDTGPEARKRLAIRLHHGTLPYMDAAGLVEYDAGSNAVRYRGGHVLSQSREVLAAVEAPP